MHTSRKALLGSGKRGEYLKLYSKMKAKAGMKRRAQFRNISTTMKGGHVVVGNSKVMLETLTVCCCVLLTWRRS